MNGEQYEKNAVYPLWSERRDANGETCKGKSSAEEGREERVQIMPAKSDAQRKAMQIAEHEPGKLFERNKGLKQMSKGQLHDFASTKGKLPTKKGKK